jgi:hypothetical protein
MSAGRERHRSKQYTDEIQSTADATTTAGLLIRILI